MHEVGRNADVFNPDAGKLLRAGSRVGFANVHMHANGKDTTGHLEIAFKFHPKDYKPKFVERLMPIGTGDIDIRPMEVGPEGRGVHDADAADESHRLRAAHARGGGPHVLRRDLRIAHGNARAARATTTAGCAPISTKTTAAPLLPRGTILRVTGYYDNTPANRNVVDPRNWSGLGHRSIDNMNIMIMQGVSLTDEQFQEEVKAAARASEAQARRRRAGMPAVRVRHNSNAAARKDRTAVAMQRRRGSRAWVAMLCASAVAGIGLVDSRRAGATGRRQHHTGLRRLAAESGWVVRTAVRLHQSDVERRDAHSAWPGQQHGAGRPGSRPADEFLSAAQSLRVPGPRAEGLRRQGNRLDADEQGEDGQDLRHAQAGLRARRHIDHVEHRGRRRLEHDAGHGRQQGAGPDVRRTEEPHREGRRAVAFTAVATDDGKPNRKNMPSRLGGDYSLPPSANGLRLSFFVYRGPGASVTFDPTQTETWENTRDGGNSPWSADSRRRRSRKATGGRLRATFSEPGTYVIRALAHDGGLWAAQDVTVVVSK